MNGTLTKKPAASTLRNVGPLAPLGEFPFLLSRMRDEFDQMFERLSREFGLTMPGGNHWRWGVEVEDKDDAVVVRAEAPGFEPGDFDIQVRGNQLELRASRKAEKEDKEKGKVRQEREFFECFTLPGGVDANRAAAEYHNGILTLTLPRTAEAKAKKIAVKSA